MNEEQNDNTEKQEPSEEELDELLKAIEELKERDLASKHKNKKRSLLSIEFGGVFHHNPFLNFMFMLLLNFALAYLLIELFNLAEYQSIFYLVLFILIFTVAENIYKHYIMVNHFRLIIKSFGSIFYFGYILIAYVLDRYVLQSYFEFTEGVLLMVFITFFTIIRYFVSVYMKRKIRGF